jgi:hypothetical protein
MWQTEVHNEFTAQSSSTGRSVTAKCSAEHEGFRNQICMNPAKPSSTHCSPTSVHFNVTILEMCFQHKYTLVLRNQQLSFDITSTVMAFSVSDTAWVNSENQSYPSNCTVWLILMRERSQISGMHISLSLSLSTAEGLTVSCILQTCPLWVAACSTLPAEVHAIQGILYLPIFTTIYCVKSCLPLYNGYRYTINVKFARNSKYSARPSKQELILKKFHHHLQNAVIHSIWMCCTSSYNSMHQHCSRDIRY